MKYQPLPKRHGKSLIVKQALSMLSHYRSHLHVCTVQHSLSLTFVSVAVQFQPTISYIYIVYVLKSRSLTQMLPSSSSLHFQCRALSSPFLFSSSSSPPSPTAAIMLLMMSRHRRRALT